MPEFSTFSDARYAVDSAEAALKNTERQRQCLVQDEIDTADALARVAEQSLHGAPGSLIVEERQARQALESRVLATQQAVRLQIDALRIEQQTDAQRLAASASRAADNATANAHRLEKTWLVDGIGDAAATESAEHLAIAERFDALYERLAEVLAENEHAHAQMDRDEQLADELHRDAETTWRANLTRAQLLALAAASVFDPEGRGRMVESRRPLGPWHAPAATGFYEPGGRVALGDPTASMMVPHARAEVDRFGRVWQLSLGPFSSDARQCIGRVARESGTIYSRAPGLNTEVPVARFFSGENLIRVRQGRTPTEWSGAIWSRVQPRGADAPARPSAIELPDRPVEIARVSGTSGTLSRVVMMPLAQLNLCANPIVGGWGPGMRSKGASYEAMSEAMRSFHDLVLPELLAGRTAQELKEGSPLSPSGRPDWRSARQLLTEFVTGADPIAVERRPDGSLDILGGRHRIQIARDMGYTHVPVRLSDC